MIIREFVPNDLKRVCEIEKMSFDVDRKVPHYYNNGDGAIVMYLPVKV